MNITTRAQDFDLTPAIDDFARVYLSAALSRIDEDIVAVDLFMKDANGPRGGVDKQVLIRVRMRNRQQIALVTTHEDMYAAIRKGIKRTKRAVRRQMRKARHFEKRSLREFLGTDSLAAAPRSPLAGEPDAAA